MATASALQVREPLHARWIGRAEPYRVYLAPLAHAIGVPE